MMYRQRDVRVVNGFADSMIRDITNYRISYAESGAVSAEYAYDPFGKVVSHTGMDFDFQFSTKFYDPDIDMYYYGYRHYSPELRRWASRDPIGEEGGLNLYGFCGNDGVNKIDPCGLHRMLTGALTFERGISMDLEGYVHARNIIRYVGILNQKRDQKGRLCYEAKIKDLVIAQIADVKKEIDEHPDDVYLIAHGGIEVNGSIWENTTYVWNRTDTVIEGLDINHDGKLTPLSVFGEKLNPQNIFGCYISPRIRKIRSANVFWRRESHIDTFNAMFVALFERLQRYGQITDCRCVTKISIYEGERSDNGLTTDYVLKRFPIRPEADYTGEKNGYRLDK